MFRCEWWRALLLAGSIWMLGGGIASAQLFYDASQDNKFGGSLTSLSALQAAKMDSNIFQFNTPQASVLESGSNSVSKLDLKAPGKARKEYDEGYLQLMRKNLQGAADHMGRAISEYPGFVAAHNALGIAYLNLGQPKQARDEFARAIELDDHLPNSYLNLGCAQLQLEQYAEAVVSLKKAATIAPIDLPLQKALAYAQFKNHEYPAVIATTRFVHKHKHEDLAVVHLLAAGAWEAQRNFDEAQEELQTLLNEEPKSPLAGQFRGMLLQVQAEQASLTQRRRRAADRSQAASSARAATNTAAEPAQVRQPPQGATGDDPTTSEKMETDTSCIGCFASGTPDPGEAAGAGSGTEQPYGDVARQVIRVKVQEVAMLFAATDHGNSVTNLSPSDIRVREDNQAPASILGFYNVTQLPLRIGLIIDMSNSVTERFTFEQGAASRFLETAVTDKDDLAFVIGFNWSVFLAQDFTPDQAVATNAINRLAPGGGTALWNAVAFGAEKLGSRPESKPVARVLVVISDGDDNSSSVSLQDAIWAAQRGQVAVYTVSTKEGFGDQPNPLLGNRALKTLSEQTGGGLFTPGSLNNLARSLADLQQVLRGRYVVTYKPASSTADGRYHSVEIKAEKDGHKLKVYARKGYYASALIDSGF